jgi:hypothetical protein
MCRYLRQLWHGLASWKGKEKGNRKRLGVAQIEALVVAQPYFDRDVWRWCGGKNSSRYDHS